MTYNGWSNHATWTANLFANCDYGLDDDPVWRRMVTEAAQAGPDALQALYTEVTGYAADILTDVKAPLALRLYVSDLVADALEEVDWVELAEHHKDD